MIPAVHLCLGVCVLHNRIYAAGGYDGQDQLNSVERYDVETETWTFVAPMKHRRSALGITAHQGRIYVLGEAPGRLVGGEKGSYVSILELRPGATELLNAWRVFCNSVLCSKASLGILGRGSTTESHPQPSLGRLG